MSCCLGSWHLEKKTMIWRGSDDRGAKDDAPHMHDSLDPSRFTWFQKWSRINGGSRERTHSSLERAVAFLFFFFLSLNLSPLCQQNHVTMWVSSDLVQDHQMIRINHHRSGLSLKGDIRDPMPRHPICSGVFQTSFRSANDGIQIQNNLWIPSNVLCSKISKLGCPFFLGFERFFFKQGRIFLIFWSDHGFPGSSKQGVLLTAWDGRGELAEWVALRMMWCHYLPILLCL